MKELFGSGSSLPLLQWSITKYFTGNMMIPLAISMKRAKKVTAKSIDSYHVWVLEDLGVICKSANCC